MAANEHKHLIKNKTSFIFQLIVGSKQAYKRKPQQDLAAAWSFNAISITNHETSNDFQQRVVPSCIDQLIVKLASNTDYDRLLAHKNILNATDAILTSGGAQVLFSKLIVGYHNSKISLHFCNDCRIFCEEDIVMAMALLRSTRQE
jgi:hypothetical protein